MYLNIFQAPHAVNGYLCTDSDMMCYNSDYSQQDQYWKIDLETPRNISRILYQGNFAERIDGAQIRAGLSSTVTNNLVVVTLTLVAHYYLQSYEIKPPVLARYIGITGPNSRALELCTLMAFE